MRNGSDTVRRKVYYFEYTMWCKLSLICCVFFFLEVVHSRTVSNPPHACPNNLKFDNATNGCVSLDFCRVYEECPLISPDCINNRCISQTETCKLDSDCPGRDSFCFEHAAHNRRHCLFTRKVGDACVANAECTKSDSRSVCHAATTSPLCSCNEDSKYDFAQRICIPLFCQIDEDCKGLNQTCLNGKCGVDPQNGSTMKHCVVNSDCYSSDKKEGDQEKCIDGFCQIPPTQSLRTLLIIVGLSIGMPIVCIGCAIHFCINPRACMSNCWETTGVFIERRNRGY